MTANAYATPAGAQGFAPHHDDHDVFALQLSGTKTWRLYEPLAPLPVEPEGSLRRDLLGLGRDVQLTAGDLLYLPRGTPHEAVAGEAEASLHLTIGVRTHTWVDALGRMLRSAPRLRASVRSAETELQTALSELERLARDADAPRRLLNALGELERSSLASRFSLDVGRLAAISNGRVEADTRLRVRRAADVRLVREPTALRVEFPGGSLSLEPTAEPVLLAMLATETFTPREFVLPAGAETACALAEELLAGGVLVREASA